MRSGQSVIIMSAVLITALRGRIFLPALVAASRTQNLASVRPSSTMADQQYTSRKKVNEKTLFDYMDSDMDVNLKMGTPGEVLLKKSSQLMKTAALHRLVRCARASCDQCLSA